MMKTGERSSRYRVVFCVYLLVSFIVTAFYIFTFGYSFWGTDIGGGKLDILAWVILSAIIIFQFNEHMRIWSWLILSPSYVIVLLLFSNLERFNINVVYLGFMLTVVMMALAALFNRFQSK